MWRTGAARVAGAARMRASTGTAATCVRRGLAVSAAAATRRHAAIVSAALTNARAATVWAAQQPQHTQPRAYAYTPSAFAAAAICAPRRVSTGTAAVLRAAASSSSSSAATAAAATAAATSAQPTTVAAPAAGSTKVATGDKPQSQVRLYCELVKMRLLVGVLWSCIATGGVSAMAFGTGSASAAVFTTLGTYACIAGANTFNQLIEVERDRKMPRTAKRPFVTGAWSRRTGWALGIGHSVAGRLLLAQVNLPLAILGVGTIALYAGPYTLLKPITSWNTWVGAVVGAMPPVMGVAAAMPAGVVAGVCSGLVAIALHPFALWGFCYQFAWQMLHFYPMQYDIRDQYAKGEYQMMSLNDPLGVRTSNATAVWTALTMGLALCAPAVGFTSPMGFITLFALHLPSLFYARSFVSASRAAVAAANTPGAAAATKAVQLSSRRLWKYSVALMMAVYTALLFHMAPQTATDHSNFVTRWMAAVNRQLSSFCIHNRWYGKDKPTDAAAEQSELSSLNATQLARRPTPATRESCAYARVADAAKANDATAAAAAAAALTGAAAATADTKRA